MLKNPHPEGTKQYKQWNKVIVILVFLGIVLGFVIRSIQNKYF